MRFEILFLLVVSGYCGSISINDCEKFCHLQYDKASIADACVFGCKSPKPKEAETDEYNVNLNCENTCKILDDGETKSACYTGCTYMPPAVIQKPIYGGFLAPIISKLRIMSIFGSNSGDDSAPDPGVMRETHIRVVVPNGPGPHMSDEAMEAMMNMMHGSMDEPADTIRVIRIRANTGSEDMSDQVSSICRRARIAIHRLSANPLFMMSIILMFCCSVTLVLFTCIRLRARQARRAAFRRQFRRMPAFSRPASVKVGLLSQQPNSWDAPELPPKEPLV